MAKSVTRAALITLGVMLPSPLLSACAASAQRPAEMQAQAGGCPISRIPGLRANVMYKDDGVAIVLTAPPQELDALRAATHRLAEVNREQGDALAVCPCAATAVGATQPMGAEAPRPAATPQTRVLPDTDAKVTDTPTGAVLTLSLRDESGHGGPEVETDYQAYNLMTLRTAATEEARCWSRGATD